MVSTYDISNLDILIQQTSEFKISKVLEIGLQNIKIRKSKFVAKTQFLSPDKRKMVPTKIEILYSYP